MVTHDLVNPMTFLTDAERQTLAAICDTLIPALDGIEPTEFSRYCAADSDLVTRLEEAYEKITTPEERRDLKAVLRTFEIRAVQGLLVGNWRSFSRMTPNERMRALADWGNSRIPLRRKAFQSFKRLALFLGYANLPEQETNPLWETMGYHKAPPPQNPPRTIQPLGIREAQRLQTDVLIIGSGAGGGVVAGELTAAGHDVLIVEKGGYFAESDFDGNERYLMEALFEKHGTLTTEDTAMVVLAGSTLGGGTTINWSASFRTPDHVLQEWADDYGISDAISPSWQASLDAVSQRMNVNCDESDLNGNNRVFAEGVESLGWHLETIPRNVKNCVDCSFCYYGCTYGAKQGTLKTYLQDAAENGARFLVNAMVRRVLHENGKATGAIVEARDAEGNVHICVVQAKVVVVSAGSIHTPAILQRSALHNPQIGANLHLHPTAFVFSRFEDPINFWQGVPMSRVSKELADLDGRHYGVTLEVAPAHPGLTASTIPWNNGREHKHLMGQFGNMANIIAITRDYHGGRVKLDQYGNPVLDYHLRKEDAAHVLRGILGALRIHHAAGASAVYAPHNQMMFWNREEGDSQFVRFLRRVEDAGLKPNAPPLFSAHQMSSCRMAGSPEQGALKPTGETWEVRNLFVADASVLPTATGVNPMVSIMAAAHQIAQHIKAAMH